MLYSVHKYRISIAAMQIASLETFYDIYIYINTNYVTRCRYICNTVRCAENQFSAVCAQI
jgi:hypothetical protein